MLSPLGGTANGTEHREAAVMAPERDQHDRQRTVGFVPHDALVRVDRRVNEILARREGALQQTGLSLSLSPVQKQQCRTACPTCGVKDEACSRAMGASLVARAG